MKANLTKTEEKMLKIFERGEWKSLGAQERNRHIKAARAHIKEKRINLRLANNVLDELKQAAMEQGIPYQTFISSILYRYAHGYLHDAQHILGALKLLRSKAA